jgi:hypothetical protein
MLGNPSVKTFEDWVKTERFVRNDDKFDPDPSLCPVPELLPANVIPMEIFQLVRDQYIVAGLGTVVGINKVAVIEVMRLYSGCIDDPLECFEKCCVLASIEIAHIQELSNKSTESSPQEGSSDGNRQSRTKNSRKR